MTTTPVTQRKGGFSRSMTETLEQLVQQLRSPDAAQRRQAIMALANLRDPAALPSLAHIYRNDPDMELRDLALKAERYIRQAADAAQATAGESTGAAAGTGPASRQGEPTERDIQLARSYLDAATDFMLTDDKGRAIESLGRALALNPGLADESFIENMIVTVTGMAPAQAVPILVHPERRGQLIVQLGYQKEPLEVQRHHGEIIEAVTWTQVAVDLGIYWVASTISAIVMQVFGLELLEDFSVEAGYSFTPFFDLLVNTSLLKQVLSSSVQGIGSGFFAIMLLLVMHFLAVTFLGGDANMEIMCHKVLPLMTAFTAANTLILAIFWLIGSFISIWFLPVVLGSGALLFLVYVAIVLGRVYDFGLVSGLISVIQGVLFYGGIQILIVYLLDVRI